MSEERLARLEDMMWQLIGMVEKVLSEQHEMRRDMAEMKQEMSEVKQDIGGIKQEMSEMKQVISGIKQEMTQINGRMEKVEAGHPHFNDSILYLMDKSTQHDHDIHVLKRHILK